LALANGPLSVIQPHRSELEGEGGSGASAVPGDEWRHRIDGPIAGDRSPPAIPQPCERRSRILRDGNPKSGSPHCHDCDRRNIAGVGSFSPTPVRGDPTFRTVPPAPPIGARALPECRIAEHPVVLKWNNHSMRGLPARGGRYATPQTLPHLHPPSGRPRSTVVLK